MNIFVTGASGFVGGASVAHLVQAGHTLYAMSRREQSDAKLRSLGAEPVRCSLEDVRASHLKQADVVIHSAAFVEQWGPRDAWYEGNVVGTRNVLQAALEAGCRRFIHIGTEAALVHGQHLDNVDEDYPLALNSPYPYAATKAEAEIMVRNANSEAMQTIVLRPRFIWGPGDQTLLPTIEQMAADGGWVWIDGGKAETSTTHIANLTHAIELALTRGTGGDAYFILDDGSRSLREMIGAMANAANLELGDRSLPGWLADGAAWLCERVWRAFNLRGAPPLTRHGAMVMSRRCVLDGAKAKHELGYAPVISVQAGLDELAVALAERTG